MLEEIASQRIALATTLATQGPEPFGLHRSRLRFSLGASAADLKIPFHFTPGAEHIFVESARQLALMLSVRHRALVPPLEYEPLVLRDEYAALPGASDSLFATTGGPDLRATAELGIAVHPLLTGGVMSSWLSQGGGGRSLVALVIGLMQRAVGEMQGCRGREATPALVAMMIASLVPKMESGLRALPLPHSLERALRGAAGLGMFLAVRLGVDRGLKRLGKVGQEILDHVDATLSPLAFLGGIAGARVAGETVYGYELLAGIPGSDEALELLGHTAPDKVAKELARTLGLDKKSALRAEQAVAAGGLRPLLLRVSRACEAGLLPSDLSAMVLRLAVEPGRLAALLGEEGDERKDLGKALLQQSLASQEGQRALTELGNALKKGSPRDPAGSVRLSRALARERYAWSALACVADQLVERSLRLTRRFFSVRRGDESEGGLDAEYAQGRVYRLSERPEPILRSQLQAHVGHFFIDVKDFTRRTALLGQAVMADFLRREFYQPILRAARGHHPGGEGLGPLGISVNNLLGDAISLSGDIEALVGMARDIRRHLDGFGRRLQGEISAELVGQAVAAIEAEYAQRAKGLAPSMTPERLAAEKATALARARGEGLEAGLFISYGPAPLVVVVDDEVFGRSRVAIGERINESARGTARSGGARARADALLEAERERRRNPSLEHPFSVFIGAPFVLHLPAEVESAARKALEARNVPEAMRALGAPMRQLIDELSRATDEKVGDIYNAGAALSDEALLAFQEACGERRQFRELTVDPSTLHPEIHARYFFPPEPFRLVVSFYPDGSLAELFRYVGRALFKGLEKSGGIGVWELLGESGLFPLLARHNAKAWWRTR